MEIIDARSNALAPYVACSFGILKNARQYDTIRYEEERRAEQSRGVNKE